MAERITFELNGDTHYRGRAGYAVTVCTGNDLRLDHVIGADNLPKNELTIAKYERNSAALRQKL